MYREDSEEERLSPDKICRVCRVSQSKSFFNKNKANKDGLDWRCRECSKTYYSAFHKSNPDSKRSESLKRLYGITIADYDKILEDQGGGCAICGKPQGIEKNRLAVD